MSAFVPALAQYGRFEEVLNYRAGASCEGCRSDAGKMPDCTAKDCVKENTADFCGEYADFPCEKNRVQGGLR